MADREKLRSLHAELTQQEQKLEEIKEQVGDAHAPEAHAHVRSVQDVIAATKKSLQTLIEVLGDAGL